MNENALCQHVREDGSRCDSSIGLGLTGLCIHHDPDRAELATEIRRSGAKAQGAAIRAARRAADVRTVAPDEAPTAPSTLEDIAEWHRWTAVAVATGQVDPRTAGEITRSLRELRPTLTAIGMEKRVRELEAQLATLKRERAG